MNWTVWIGLALLLALVVAVTGLGPKGGRRVASTQLMTVARVILIVAIAIVGYFFWTAGS
jgi:hypothetical protein